MKHIIILFIFWRTILFVVAAISPLVIPQFGDRFPYYKEILIGSGLPHYMWSFANFDGVHYIRIAEEEYQSKFTQAFFPIYPILLRIVSEITRNNTVLTGILLSNTFFLGGLIIFYKLVKEHYSEKTAFWSSLFLLAFPTSFYFGAVYTEGLFFTLVVSFFYLSAKGNGLAASLIGIVATATRLVGIFLLPAFLLTKNLKNKGPALLIPLGLIFYMIYLQLKFNNALFFLTSQSGFGQGRSSGEIILLPQVLYRYLKILTSTNGLTWGISLFELLSTLFALSVLIIASKKVKTEWLLFSIPTVLLPTLTGNLASMPRYIIIAFPIYIVLALIPSTPLKLIILALFLCGLIVSTILFTQGYWVA